MTHSINYNNIKFREIFIPKIPSMNIMDLAAAIAPECKTEIVGIRPGEKLHEILVPEDDARRTIEFDNYYVIQPELSFWKKREGLKGKICKDGFSYTSDNNSDFMSVDRLRSMIDSKQNYPSSSATPTSD